MVSLWPGGPLELPHTVVVDGVSFTLPDIPTRTLFKWLTCGAWTELIPGSVDQADRLQLDLRLIDDLDPFDLEHYFHISTSVFGRLAGTASGDRTGTGWWPAHRLAATAAVNWPLFVGWCASHGTEPLEGPLWRVIGGIYGWLRDNVSTSEKETQRLERTIWAPPPHVMVPEPDKLPHHVREAEAAGALASLRESLPGEDKVTEWRKSPTR